jgi:predicted nucleic acid-binding protein
MTWFVDTNVLVYALTNGPRREPCLQLLRAIAAGEVRATTSTLVIEELWHLESRLSLAPGSARAAVELFPELVSVGEWAILSAMDDAGSTGLGTADRVHAATCRSERLVGIISADRAFDSVAGLSRIEPDSAGIAALLVAG